MSDWSIRIDTTPGDRDAIIADLWEAGTTGITEEESGLRAFFGPEVDRAVVLQRFALLSPSVQNHEPYDWVRHAEGMWGPIAVGDRLWLAPEWIEDATPKGRIRLPMRAGMASGSGLHAATRLSLVALERLVTPGISVLDVGTGSGILADAARLLGAGVVAGCDIDHKATQIARRNVPHSAFFTGSLRSVRDRSFDLVVGNLNAAVIATLGADLGRVAAETVVVSGFREDEVTKVAKLLTRPVIETLELEDWACLVC